MRKIKTEIKECIMLIESGEIPKGYKKVNYGIIPENWINYKIEDASQFEGGAQPSKDVFIFKPKEGYIRLIQIRDYKTDEYKTFIPKNLARKVCNKDDIMIGRYGPPIFQILRGLEGAYNVALIKAIVNEDKIIKEYFYYYLNTESLFKLIDKLSRRSSGQTGIDIEALNNFPLPLPSKKEQIRICGVLSCIDKLIGLEEKLIQQKKVQKNGLIQNLLLGKVRVAKSDNVPPRLLKERIDGINRGEVVEGYKKSSLAIIPKEWEERELSHYIRNVERKVNKPKEGYWRLGIRSHAKGTFHEFVEDPNSVEMESLFVVKKNDLIVNITFAWEHAIAVADINDDGKLVSHRFPTYEFKNNADPIYYKYFITQPFFKYQLKNISPGGAGRNRVMCKKDFLTLPVVIPPIHEQQKIAVILSTLDKEIYLLEQKLEFYKMQKKGLMQLLLSGKVRVKC